MRHILTTAFLLTAAALALLPLHPAQRAHAQDAPPPGLTGVFLGGSGDAAFMQSALSMFNPDTNAVPVALTPFFPNSSFHAADTLNGLVRQNGGNGANTSSFAPAMSASGRTVFVAQWFGGRYDIVAQDRDGTNRTVLTPLGISSFQGVMENMFPDISPDGQTVIYALNPGGRGLTGGPLHRVPSDGSAEPELFCADNRIAASCTFVRAVFSPDGTQVAGLGYQSVEAGLQATLWIMNADGTIARAIELDEPPTRSTGWRGGTYSLDWKGDTILFTMPTYYEGANPQPGPRLSLYDVAADTIAGNVSANIGSYPWAAKLSPDARYVGYLVRAPAWDYHHIVVSPVDPNDGYEYTFDGTFPYGRMPIFDWADAPPVPEPARLEFEDPSVLLWQDHKVQINPVLYDADGNVISRTVHTYAVEGGGPARINQFTHEVWGDNTNQYHDELCATNGGIERCLTYNNVHTPLLDVVVLDDDIAEEGRNEGRVRLYRWGRPDVDVIPGFEARPFSGQPARHYLDYTLSELPERIRWPASEALEDTLQTWDVTLTPIDDGLQEPALEYGQLVLQCSGVQGSIFGPDDANCLTASSRRPIPHAPDGIGSQGRWPTWTFAIQSNGAGSGMAIGTSSPEVIPASGQATLTINGQGFAAGATATLTGPSTLTATSVAPRHGGVQAHARFELDEAHAGTYDLVVAQGGTADTLASAVTVEAGTPGGVTDVWATLQSRNGRFGLPLTQYIHYGNDGTADAALTPMLIAIPPGFEVEFSEPLYQFPNMPAGYDPTASPWVQQEVVAQDVPGLCVQAWGRAGGTVECVGNIQPFDRLQYSVAVVFLPTIPPGGRGTLGVDVTKVEEVTLPWFVKIGAPFNTLDYEEEGAANAGGAVAAALTASTGPRVAQPANLETCTNVSAATATGAALEADVSQGAACLSCMNAILDLLVGELLGVDCLKAGVSATRAAFQTAIDAAAGADGVALIADASSTMTNIAIAAAECGSKLFPPAAAFTTAYTLITNLNSALACFNCFGLDPVWGIVGEVYARDPNDKLGPVGVGEGGYVGAFGRMGYTVRFENLATATAAAVEVTITDTLDTSVYDLSTFELAEISLQDTTFTPPSGLQTWTTFWDRRPDEPSIVRIHGALDPETGVATWILSDLDPTSYALRTSAEAGFLPPNDADGAGEGHVRFLIRTLENLPDGTVAANRATIRFDRNELIHTPVWANTLDRVAPVSSAATVEPAGTDTSWVVRFDGEDGGAGVAAYDLYVQAAGEPFAYYGTTRADSLVFHGDRSQTYGFYVIATDWTGNVEASKQDAEVTLPGAVAAEPVADGPERITLGAPYPNPARRTATLRWGLPDPGHVVLRVYDVLGREVARLDDRDAAAGWHTTRWVPPPASGLYVVRLEATTGSERTLRVQHLVVVE